MERSKRNIEQGLMKADGTKKQQKKHEQALSTHCWPKAYLTVARGNTLGKVACRYGSRSLCERLAAIIADLKTSQPNGPAVPWGGRGFRVWA